MRHKVANEDVDGLLPCPTVLSAVPSRSDSISFSGKHFIQSEKACAPGVVKDDVVKDERSLKTGQNIKSPKIWAWLKCLS